MLCVPESGSIPADFQKIEVEKGPEPPGVPYCEWKARELNRLLNDLGTPGPGRTPASSRKPSAMGWKKPHGGSGRGRRT
jgi:hypothetical protein